MKVNALDSSRGYREAAGHHRPQGSATAIAVTFLVDNSGARQFTKAARAARDGTHNGLHPCQQRRPLPAAVRVIGSLCDAARDRVDAPARSCNAAPSRGPAYTSADARHRRSLQVL